MKKLFVTQPVLPSIEEFNKYLEIIWENKVITNGGDFHKELECKLAEFLGVKHLSLFSNGTNALLTALQALDIEGEVITTPYSFVATSNVLWWNRITPVFVDIDKKTCNIDAKKIEAAINEKTKAILPVHVYGVPCDVEAIEKIAQKYNLKVIYDAAHAFGVQYNGQSILKYGDLSMLSFHATKVFNTIEGGAIICHSDEMKRHIDNLKNFGIVNDTTVVAPGINGKMNELQAAFGLLNLKSVKNDISKRQKVAFKYDNVFGKRADIRITDKSCIEGYNYGYYPILVQREKRDQLYFGLIERGIIGRRYFYPAISEFPMYKNLKSASIENLPITSEISSSVICLPIFPQMEESQVNFVIDNVLDILNNILSS